MPQEHTNALRQLVQVVADNTKKNVEGKSVSPQKERHAVKSVLKALLARIPTDAEVDFVLGT